MKKLLLSIFVMLMVVSTQAQSDFIRIVYDASMGTSTLQGADKVYMHSGANTWLNEPEGQMWGEDNGIGEMTAVEGETDKWEITIDVRDFYGLAEDDEIGIIGMVFRSADGVMEGKDDAGTDIFLNGIDTDSPFALQSDGSAFAGVTANWAAGFAGIEELEVTNTAVAYPNPAPGRTTISYATSDEEVSLTIYNLVGQVVKVLANDFHSAGTYDVLWDGTNQSGAVAPTGQYFYVLESPNAVTTKSLLLVR